jgi:cation diffusion facilitator CzcD-associated flavoprotein CzcO
MSEMSSEIVRPASKQVAVIGAGIAGLVTAKVLLSQGHAVTVFEQAATLGGVWSPQRAYPGLRIQVPRKCYCYSDFPMPDHYPELPTSQQVYEYLDSYARHFGVVPHIRFRTAVDRLGRRPDGRDGWQLHLRALDGGGEATRDFDFVVVCNGLFGVPDIPDIPGREEFRAKGGIVLHTLDLKNVEPLTGRDVVIVGFGKSAIDIAETSLPIARSTTLVCRRIIWKVPRRFFRKVHSKYFFLSRFTEIWFPHPDMGRAKRFLHRYMRWFVKGYWRMAEILIGIQLGLRSPYRKPAETLRSSPVDVGLAPEDDFAALKTGRIALHRGAIARFTADGIELDDGKRITAQTVILATGYRQSCEFLGETERKILFDDKGAPQLYRTLINPDIPFMAFNGYNGLAACQLTAEVGAVWLAQYLAGCLDLPPPEAMRARVRLEFENQRRLLSTKIPSGYFITPFTFGHLDQLMSDLRLPPVAPRLLFRPIDPRDYMDLMARAQAASVRS